MEYGNISGMTDVILSIETDEFTVRRIEKGLEFSLSENTAEGERAILVGVNSYLNNDGTALKCMLFQLPKNGEKSSLLPLYYGSDYEK